MSQQPALLESQSAEPIPGGERCARRHRLLFVVESGTDVRLIEGFNEIAELSILARKIDGGREISQETAIPLTLKVGPTSRAGFAELVFRELFSRRQAYDICMVQGYGLAALAANCAGRLTGKPTLMLVCSPAEDYYLCRRVGKDPQAAFRRSEYWGLKLLAQLNARLGGKYIVLSRYLESKVNSHGPNPWMRVIPLYGVDLEIFKPVSIPKPTIRAELNLPPDGSLIFASSRVAPEKDTNTLLQALKLLVDSGRNVWLLTLTGRHAQFQQMAQEFGVKHRVIVADAVHPLHDLPAYYCAADVCVQVSRAEGLGFSPLEALACGTPVVATAVGGLTETIVDGATGWTHKPGDAQHLAAQISVVLDHPAEAARRAAAGREMVAAVYDRRKLFQDLMQSLDKIVANS